MADITISLSENQMNELRGLCKRLGVSTKELVRAGVEDLLTGMDEELGAHVDRILEKNKELYDRLAG